MGKGLGRGFDSLIPTDWVDEGFDLAEDVDGGTGRLVELEIAKIEPDSDQPRKRFDEEALRALAQSIETHGVLQPIVVTKAGTKYKIVAGERRWRAAKIAKLKRIPAIIRTMDEQKRLEMSVIENAQREDLNAIELAAAYAKLATQFNLETKEIAKRVGKSESAIVNTLRLLNLPEEAKKLMLEYKLTEGIMRPLVTLPEEKVMELLPKIIKEGWTVHKLEQYLAEKKPKSSEMAMKKEGYFKKEEELSEKYEVRTKIKARSVTFMCKNEVELKKLLKRL